MTDHQPLLMHTDVQPGPDSTAAAMNNDAEPKQLDFETAFTQLAHAAIADLVAGIKELDLTLMEIDWLLNDFQPLQTGKIRIRFMMIDGLPRPVPIIWRRSKKDNKWKFDKVGRSYLPLRAKRARAFWDSHEVVAELLAHAAELIQHRSDLIKSATNLRMSAQQKLKTVMPRNAAVLHRVRLIICERDDGLHRTFMTKHCPPRAI